MLPKLDHVLSWPDNPARQVEAQATWGAEMIHVARNLPPAVMGDLFHQAVGTLADARGVSVDELASPEERARIQQIFAAIGPSALEGIARKELFNPGGGYLGVARAPGSAVLAQEVERAAVNGGGLCGVALTCIAAMARYHADMTASLNRAIIAMMEHKRRNPAVATWPAERGVKDAWSRYRSVAPLWAARHLLASSVQQDAAVKGETLSLEDQISRMQAPERRRDFAAWALWFRAFASSHTPPNSGGPLIPDADLVRIQSTALPEMPPLLPLGDAELAAARAYKAPQAMQ